jgi:tetratricopeptide (TPR) repeat protein
MKLFLTINLFCLSAFIFGQTVEKYADIDALINTKSTIDAMTALKKLKEEYKKDTVEGAYWVRYSKAAYIFYKQDEAKMAINKAVKKDPDNAEYHFEKGLLYNRTNEPKESFEGFNKAVALSPEGKHYYWRGILNQQLKKNDEAEKDYLKAIELKFETPELYNNLAILTGVKNKHEEALALINKAIALNPRYSQAYSTRSQNYFFMLNIDSACKDKQRALSMRYKAAFDIPDSICNADYNKQLNYAANLFVFSKMYAAAIKAYTKLIDNNVLKSGVFMNRGYCYYQLKDYKNAEKDYLQALSFPNNNVDGLYDNLSLLYFEMDNFEKAAEWSTKRIELNPNNHVAYLDRGLSYRKLKKYKDAEKDFNKSLSIKPDFFRAFGYRSFLFLELGKTEQALADANKAIELDSKYGFAYGVRAQIKQKLGESDFCIDFYKAREYGEPDADEAIKLFCK